MNRSALADRFVSYSDALSVFPFVQTVAFSSALSDPDVRCSIADIWTFLVAGNLVFAVVTSVAIAMLRRSELSLRADTETDPMVSTYLRRLHIARYFIIWAAFIYLAFSAYSATFDPICSL